MVQNDRLRNHNKKEKGYMEKIYLNYFLY